MNKEKSKELNNAGAKLHQEGKTEEALIKYLAACEENPCNPSAHNNAGFVYAGRGEPGKALMYYEKALEIDPENSMAHLNRGICLVHLGKADEGHKALRKAVESDYNNDTAWASLAQLYNAAKRYPNAEAAWLNAVNINTEKTAYQVGLASTLLIQEKIDEAILILEKTVENNPDDPDALNQLGIAFFMKQDLKAAASLFKKVLENEPLNQKAQYYHDLITLSVHKKHQ